LLNSPASAKSSLWFVAKPLKQKYSPFGLPQPHSRMQVAVAGLLRLVLGFRYAGAMAVRQGWGILILFLSMQSYAA
jgi:hypothetical protein